VVAAQTPALDADGLARRLRASQRWAETPLVALGETADEELIEHLHETGFDHCLPKSNWDRLVTELRGLIGVTVETAVTHEDAPARIEPPVANDKGKAVAKRKPAARRGNGRALAVAEGA